MLTDREIRNLINSVESHDDFISVLNKLKDQLYEQTNIDDRISTIHYIFKLAKKNMGIVEDSQNLSTSYKDLHYQLSDDDRVSDWIGNFAEFADLIRTRFGTNDYFENVTIAHQPVDEFKRLFEELKSTHLDKLHQLIDKIIALWNSDKYKNLNYFSNVKFRHELTKVPEGTTTIKYLLDLVKNYNTRENKSVIARAIFKVVDCCYKHKPNNLLYYKKFLDITRNKYKEFEQNEPITHSWIYDYSYMADFPNSETK